MNKRSGKNAEYVAAATVAFLITMVIIRLLQLKKIGIQAFKFGEKNKKDFLIPPFALLFLYSIFSKVFDLLRLGTELFENEFGGWIGVVLCVSGLF